MSETNQEEEDPTRVYFTDGTATAYSVVIRQYDSDWLYVLRPDTPANHCVLNTENVTRIEAQTVISVDEGVSYCDFDWRNRVETLANQDLWIAHRRIPLSADKSNTHPTWYQTEQAR